MGDEAKQLDKNFIDMIHLDVMDGNFVPNLTFGPGYIKNLKNNIDIPFDVHLMIEKPENSIERYIEVEPEYITIHYESTRFPVRVLKLIKDKGIIAGISINPATPVETIFDLLPYLDMVLIMSVDPGFFGQSFMEISIKKVEKLHKFIKNNKYNTIIQIDGGINKDNISRVVNAGVEIIVAGSSVFKGGNANNNAKELKKMAGFIKN